MTVTSAALGIAPAAIAALCRKWKVQRLALFGSSVRDDFRPDSDVDVAVSFDPESHWGLWDIVVMQEELQALFGRDVDIVEMEAIENPIRRKIISESMRMVYEE